MAVTYISFLSLFWITMHIEVFVHHAMRTEGGSS
jgi:hypothetical protein